jgi:uncharacterized protein YdiU (UPF0061 family)
MNTDNMSILGLTIDYGPYGWLEDYNPNWTPNTTDRENRRYRFGNQAEIGLWNLYQLANALSSDSGSSSLESIILERYQTQYQQAYLEMMQNKLGLFSLKKMTPAYSYADRKSATTETDMTFFRKLSK